ncbi:acyltransferase family protein [Ancylobacter sp.]|uniref:acyltransferase family protein n=1 Tax=Ancylobacter sp. TaxID=1872567 RepID=UPI003D0DCEC5
MAADAGSERFEVLDAWRGLCAVMVVVYHYSYFVRLDGLQNALIANAYLFVDFFFVLSGFVVCHAYAGRIGGVRQAGGFLLRRIGRLWPLHLTVLFAFMLAIMAINLGGRHPEHLLIEAGTGNYSMRGLQLNAALLNSMGLYGVAWNGPAWSIGAEFYTYALFAAVLLTLGARRLMGVALVLSMGAMAAVLLYAPAYMNSTADFGFLRCIAGFFAGVVACHAHRRWREVTLPGAGAWEAGAVLLAGLFFVAAGDGPDRVAPWSVMAPVVFALVILVFAREAGSLSRLMKAPVLAVLGRWSYSIYLLHMPLLIVLGYFLWLYGDVNGIDMRPAVEVLGSEKRLYDLGSPILAVGLLAALLALVIALAGLTFRLVEVPWRERFTLFARNCERGGRVLAPLPPRAVTSVPARARRLVSGRG